MDFTTVDDDGYSDDNCAADRGGGGNWWGNNCAGSNINGKYGSKGDSGNEFMFWWSNFNNEWFSALKTMRLMIRPAD